MANQQIVEFIKHSLSEGKPEAEILDSLRKVGWPEAEVQAARLASVVPPVTAPVAPSLPPPQLHPLPPQQPATLQASPQSQALSPNPFPATKVAPPLNVAQVTPMAPVTQTTQPFRMGSIQPQAIKAPSKSSKKIWFITVPIVVVLLLLAGGGYYAYQKGYIFSQLSSLPEKFFDKGLDGTSGISSASYQFSMSFKGEPREADAEPFTYTSTKKTSSEPKPALAEALEGLGQMASFFSRETSIISKTKGSGGQSGEVKLSETNFSLDTIFGDLSAAFAVDVITKDKTIYVRLGKFPSLPGLAAFFDPALIKGKWVEIKEQDIKDTFLDLPGTFALPVTGDLTNEGIFDSKKALEAYKKMLIIAKEESLIKVNGAPTKEKINGEDATRYDLSFDRQALAQVYKRSMTEVLPLLIPGGEDYPSSTFVDESIIKYLASDEFKVIYDYVAKNNSLSVWFNQEMYPVQAIFKSRIVPNASGFGNIYGGISSAPTTSKKSIENESQFILEMTFNLQDINKTALPEVPKEFMSLEEAEKLFWRDNNPLTEARNKAKDAAIKANLSSFRVSAELYYSKNNTFGPGFALGPCPGSTSTLKNIFTDPDSKKIFEQIATVTSPTRSYCAASDQSYAVAAPLVTSGGYYCVDSSGKRGEINNPTAVLPIIGNGTKADPFKCALPVASSYGIE